ncbi:MAG TPA: ABC transporter ATP-binding protein [Crinalium sp.]|jgi:iron(III) transport system ATP-binding protein
MTQPPILQLENVTKQFANADIPAVRDITLTLAQGHLLGLLGPSGCGKTTLLRLIAGFERPQTGRVKLAGQTVADAVTCVAPERRSIGMVFQDFALFPHLTVAENVAFGLKPLKPRQKSKHQHLSWVCDRTVEAIALVGLQGKENRYPHELSGGQQQRVALARALAPRPNLILLDEPLSNLDVQVRLYLRQEVRDVLKATGTSAIFVTHDQEEALSIADQVGVMHQGQIEQISTPEEIYRDPTSRFVAEFVTQANFLPAQRREAGWETEIGLFPGSLIDSDTGELMIRQEDLIPALDEDGVAVVRDRHFLGREYRYCLVTPSGLELRACTLIDVVLPIGERVKLSVVKPFLKVFPKRAVS